MALSVAGLTMALHGQGSTAWYGGGSYDGYDRCGAIGLMDHPQINNAGGATNVTAVAAWLNGMLTATGGAPTLVIAYWGLTDAETNATAWDAHTSLGYRLEGEALTVNVPVVSNQTYYYRFYGSNNVGRDGWAPVSAVFAVPGRPGVNVSAGAFPVGRFSATLHGALTSGVTANLEFQWGAAPGTLTNSVALGSQPEGSCRVRIGGLTPETQYYYRLSAINDYGHTNSSVAAFVTGADSWFFGGGYDGYDGDETLLLLDHPQVNNAGGATNISATHAWLNGALTATGGAPTRVHVFWGLTDAGTNSTAVGEGAGLWDFKTNLGYRLEGERLTVEAPVGSSQPYYYRFYATNDLGREGWAATASSFLTPGVPELDTVSGAQPVGRVSATLHGALVGGTEAQVILYWGTQPDAWSHTNDFGTIPESSFRLVIDGLSPGTEYAYRLEAVNPYGAATSAVIPFVTGIDSWYGGGSYDGYDDIDALAPMDHPQINNAGGATNVNSTQAWLNGVLVATGDSPTRTYVFWGVTDGGVNETDWDIKTYTGYRQEGEPISVRVEVTPNTTHYYRYYAINRDFKAGWSSRTAVFNTPGPPQVDTAAGAAPVGSASATLHGRLNSGVSAEIEFHWGTAPEHLSNTNPIGAFAEGPLRLTLAGLASGQDYCYRIQAVNADGVSQSGIASFRTGAGSWFGGGSYDGYDDRAIRDPLRPRLGTTVILH